MSIRLHLLLGLLAGMLLTTALALLAAWPHWAAWQRGGQLEVVHWETPVSPPADEANGDLPDGQDAGVGMAVGRDNQGKTTVDPAAGGDEQTFDAANPLATRKHASDQAPSHDPLLHGGSDAETLNTDSRAAPAEVVLPAGPEGALLVHDPVEVDPFWWVCAVVGVWCLTMVLLVATLWLLGVRLLAPLMDLQARMAEMATGEADLSVTMPVRGIGLANTMALAFNGFMKRLNIKIAAVKGASSEAAEGTHLIAQVSQEMALDLVKQQRNAQVIDEAANGMVEDAQAVSMMAKQACDQVDAAVDTAREGVDVVMVAMSSMQDVIDAVEKASGWMTSLRDQSGSIGQMVDVINDIAEHINMLSLNAGVEAARAGEKGRGFAVVAKEINKLADRTTAATQQIIDSILNMQTVTDEARSEMGHGVQTVSQGLGRAKERLQTIVSDVNGVSGLIQQVSERARHQSTSCIDIQRSVISIRKSLDTSVNASEENATSVEQLSVKAKQVNGLLADLAVYDRRAREGEIPQEVADRRSGPNLNENIRRILKVFVSPNIDDLIEQTMADMAAGKSIDMEALENMDLSAFGVPDAGPSKH